MNDYSPYSQNRNNPADDQSTSQGNGINALYNPVAPGYGPAGQEGFTLDFWKILNILTRWWWLILIVVGSIFGATYYYVNKITPKYAATTTLNVKQQSRNIVDVSEVESIIADREFLLTQIELLKSEKLAEDVIVSLDLLNDADFSVEGTEGAASMTRDQKLRRAVLIFSKKLKVEPIERSRIIELSFVHTNPNQAARIANALTKTFIEGTMKSKVNSTRFAREFLEGRLVTVRQSLEDAERELVEYASANNIIRLENGEDSGVSGDLATASLVTLNEKLTLAQIERIQAESAYQAAQQSQFLSDTLESAILTNLKKERTALNSAYLEKLKTFKPEYPDMLELKSRIRLFDEEIDRETGMIVNGRREELRRIFELSKVTEGDLKARVAGLKTSVTSTREKLIDYNILKRQVDTERSQYDALLQRLKEVSVSDDVGSSLVEVVDPATVPRYAFSPRKGQSLLLALLASTALALGLALALEMIDNKIRTPDDVKGKLGLSTIGVVPKESKSEDILQLLKNPLSNMSEGYASLKANLQSLSRNGGPKLIQFTSTKSGEGKSVSSMGLAIRYASDNLNTLLIDADMRRPTFTPEDNNTVGLTGVLTRDIEFRDGISPVKDLPGLSLMASGNRPLNPSGLLSSRRFAALLAWAKDNYDYVIVDGPPVMGLADAPILGAKVDATLLVVEADELRTPRIKNAIERLAISGVNVVGTVLTKYNDKRRGYGYGYYDYNYGNAKSGNRFLRRKPEKKDKVRL